jgi:glycosyltransferase involved in cell wall biosynthesis
VPPADVQRTISGAAAGLCLIQPICRSYELSLPNKLFEYIAAGVPIIGADLPVIAAVVGEGQLGEVVPAAGPVALAAAVNHLLEPATRARVTENIRAYAAANTGAAETELLAAVYRRLGVTG